MSVVIWVGAGHRARPGSIGVHAGSFDSRGAKRPTSWTRSNVATISEKEWKRKPGKDKRFKKVATSLRFVPLRGHYTSFLAMTKKNIPPRGRCYFPSHASENTIPFEKMVT